ncbi:MAG: PEP/pyruvate-binding domain-containing protein [Woeseiaceae bacterium]|nr:PEP/pyruvate-binding domain-containing protein [Woeseiaceae bacterium]
MKQPANDVFFLGAGKPARGRTPAALKRVALDTRALDWQIQSIDATEGTRLTFIGGYQVDEVIRNYPQLNYAVVADWQGHSALHSLFKAPLRKVPTTILYADTIFRKNVIQSVVEGDADVVYGVDYHWRTRYRSRSSRDIDIAEVLKLDNEDGGQTMVEFTGLMHFQPHVVEYLISLDNATIGKSLPDLLQHLEASGFNTQSVDVKDGWAEFNSPDDIAHFVLGSKAETLERLAPVVTRSHIGDQVTFTESDWRSSRDGLLQRIQKRFAGKRLIVRSSAKAEDNWDSANAGGFDSLLGVDSSRHEDVVRAVDAVIESYGEDREPEHDQVLVQECIENVSCSGVVFTCGLETGSPYYRVNFDDSSQSTESVTSGDGGDLRTILVFRDAPQDIELADPVIAPVLDAIRELEQILGYGKLDIEFAIDSESTVHIFQVRPISVDHSDYDYSRTQIAERLESAKARFLALQKPSPFVLGKKAIFGNMPDWNPAEIIGTRPRPLALSLYRELITDEVWARQRAGYGYRDVRPQPLITAFCGQPYVDIRASINSFIPAALPDKLAARLVDAYLGILLNNPARHDKLEFEVAFTSWTPDFAQLATERLGPAGIVAAEVAELEEALKSITCDALIRLSSDIGSVEVLATRRESILAAKLDPVDRALTLIEDCREYGTLAFAHAARAGFVATSFLKSFSRLGILTDEQVNDFMRSIGTVTRDFSELKASLQRGETSIDELQKRFGHLRPGTYDATAKAYWEEPEVYLTDASHDESDHGTTPFTWPESALEAIDGILENLGSALDGSQFIAWLADAIKARESVKFAFTRNLSLALDALIDWGEHAGVAREQLVYLEYGDFKNHRIDALTVDDMKNLLTPREARIATGELIELPQLITSEQQFYCFERFASQPNFVTLGRVEAEAHAWRSNDAEELDGKIVLIPQADPGYDWLFGRGIVGLITCYGGANSHMAIRAAELGMPAAIGVGEQLYEKLSSLRRLRLDCKNHQVGPP